MEQLIIKRLCPSVPIQRLEVNGTDVAISAIVDRVASIARLLNNRNFPICLIFDREGRSQTPDEIVSEVQTELAKRGLDVAQFRIGVCDRMIENWILADSELILREYGHALNASYEGVRGKGVLKRICEATEYYRETTVGVRLFCAANVKAMYSGSSSFKRFIDAIDFECRWSASLHN